MYPSTEDLLSVRDGQPVDAPTSEAIAASALQLNEVERLQRMRNALRNLTDVEAPAGAWERIVAVERETRFRGGAWLRGAAGVGVATAVAAAAILYLALPSGPSDSADGPSIASVTPLRTVEQLPFGQSDAAALGARVVPASYTALVAESARLEQVLGQISYQRPLMTGATASTIAGLEDRISVIDEQLTYSTARGLPQPERAALWGERVDLMNALVHVRYAQAQPTGF